MTLWDSSRTIKKKKDAAKWVFKLDAYITHNATADRFNCGMLVVANIASSC